MIYVFIQFQSRTSTTPWEPSPSLWTLFDWLMNWLLDELIYWWIDWVIDWMIDLGRQQHLENRPHPSEHYLIDWWIDCLIDWLSDWLIDELIDWLNDWSRTSTTPWGPSPSRRTLIPSTLCLEPISARNRNKTRWSFKVWHIKKSCFFSGRTTKMGCGGGYNSLVSAAQSRLKIMFA